MAEIERIKQLLDKLNNGSNVSLRDLKNVLGDEGLAEYESQWQYELDKRTQFEEKPDEIKRYEEMVHAADFDNNRAEGLKVGKRAVVDHVGRNSKRRLRDQSETKYERAIEYLEEIIEIDGNLRIWFDRDLDFDANTTMLSIDCGGVPRTVTSRSIYKRSSYMAEKRTKEDVKRDVLNNAINRIERGDELGGVGKLGKHGKFGGFGGFGGAVKEDNEKLKELKKMLSQLTKKAIE